MKQQETTDQVHQNDESFHGVLRAYRKSLAPSSPEHSSTNNNRQSLVTTLIRHSTDSALTSLTLSRCQELIDYWRQRPELDSVRRASKHYCRNCIQELMRFFDWLGVSEQFDWRVPNGLRSLHRHAHSLDGDWRIARPEPCSISDLVLLNAHANEKQRLLFYLSLNTGQGFSVLGRLKLTDFLFDSETGLPKALVSIFPRTNRYINVFLWPETRAIVNRAIKNARLVNASHLFHTASGDPLCDQSSSYSTGRLRRIYHGLTQSVKSKHVEFEARPHKALRLSVSEVLRGKFGCESASLYSGAQIFLPDRHCYESPQTIERHMSFVRETLASVFEAEYGCKSCENATSGNEEQQVT